MIVVLVYYMIGVSNMIDIRRYEGHAKEGWHFDSAHVLRDGYDKEIAELVGEDWLDDKATQKLIADAPLLLAEVRRLRSYIAHHNGDEYRQCPECGSLDFTFKFDDEGMECKCDKCDNKWKVKIE